MFTDYHYGRLVNRGTNAGTHSNPADFKTYQIAAPRSTHFRQATCEEVDCKNFLNGWVTRIPADSDLERLVRASGRKWLSTTREGAETVFTFAPGTTCFEASKHRVRIDKPELYIVKGGDWRGNPRGIEPRVHKRPEDWVDDFANNQDKLKTQIERG